ncbi:hypothetical protein ACFY19_23570 [Streptosporangium saharense]|uniref:hypothetical protein n=1 Tax=Streptosporangium saharense TaxID=1706840 RepID=UPI003683115A
MIERASALLLSSALLEIRREVRLLKQRRPREESRWDYELMYCLVDLSLSISSVFAGFLGEERHGQLHVILARQWRMMPTEIREWMTGCFGEVGFDHRNINSCGRLPNRPNGTGKANH